MKLLDELRFTVTVHRTEENFSGYTKVCIENWCHEYGMSWYGCAPPKGGCGEIVRVPLVPNDMQKWFAENIDNDFLAKYTQRPGVLLPVDFYFRFPKDAVLFKLAWD